MSRPRLTRTRRLAAAATVGTLAVGALAACGSEESTASKQADSAQAGAAQQAAETTSAKPLKQGQSTTYQDGLKATVSQAEKYESSEFAAGHSRGHTPKKVDVTLENTGDSRLNAARAQVTARTEDGTLRQIVDQETGVGFHGRLQPGKKATLSYVFDIPEGAKTFDVQVEFVGDQTEPAQWSVAV